MSDLVKVRYCKAGPHSIKFEHVKGNQNQIADILSRLSEIGLTPVDQKIYPTSYLEICLQNCLNGEVPEDIFSIKERLQEEFLDTGINFNDYIC